MAIADSCRKSLPARVFVPDAARIPRLPWRGGTVARPFSESAAPFHRGSIYADMIVAPPRKPRNRRKAEQREARARVARAHLSRAHCQVAGVVIDLAGMPGGCYASHDTLAKRAGVSVSTVERALKELQNRVRVLTWTLRKVVCLDGRVRQTSNLYSLCVDIRVSFVDRVADPAQPPHLFAASNKTLESVSTVIVPAPAPLPDVSLRGDTLARARAAAGIVLPKAREGPN